jgi:hypothetical protein
MSSAPSKNRLQNNEPIHVGCYNFGISCAGLSSSSRSISNCAMILIVWHKSGGQKGQNISKNGFFALEKAKLAAKRLKPVVKRPKSSILLILSDSDKPWSDLNQPLSDSDKPKSEVFLIKSDSDKP